MAFLVTAHVEAEMRFQEFSRAVEVAVNEALVEWAAIALEEIRAAETRVGDASLKRKVSPGVHLRDSFQVTIRRRFGGLGVGSVDIVVWTDNPNAIWQELGTRARRRKKLKSGGHSSAPSEGNRGVKPLYFMRKGASRSFPKGVALIENALRGVGAFGGGSTLIDTVSPHFFRGSSRKFFRRG